MRTAGSTAGRRLLAVAAVGVVSLTGCGGQGSASTPRASSAMPQGSEKVTLDPADFTVDITHPYWPMKPGDRWVYEENEGDQSQRVDVTVLDRTRTLADGIEAREVHDQVTTPDGELVEDTTDWYAQDNEGNLWYLGEQTAEYENGEVTSTEGSWEAGKDGAQPGILLPAHPQPGTGYRQEYLKGEAEDQGFVLSTDEQVEVPTGTYQGSLMTRDTTPLEPDVVELKLYSRGVGPVLTVTISGPAGREQLTETNVSP